MKLRFDHEVIAMEAENDADRKVIAKILRFTTEATQTEQYFCMDIMTPEIPTPNELLMSVRYE